METSYTYLINTYIHTCQDYTIFLEKIEVNLVRTNIISDFISSKVIISLIGNAIWVSVSSHKRKFQRKVQTIRNVFNIVRGYFVVLSSRMPDIWLRICHIWNVRNTHGFKNIACFRLIFKSLMSYFNI